MKKSAAAHIIWKRPDGFQNAEPTDFKRISLDNGAQLWLHKSEKDWYPFQIRGDWAAEKDTIRLNRMVQLLDAQEDQWKSFLAQSLDEHAPTADLNDFIQDILKWLETLKKDLRGDTWENEIVAAALQQIQTRLKKIPIT